MSSVNKVILVGNLGRDPETKTFDSGNSVTNLSVATTRKYTKDGEPKEETEWHRVNVWGKSGEACARFLTKGRQVYVEGRLQTRSYEKDGEKRYSTEIIADTVQFLGKKGDGGGSGHDWGDPPDSGDSDSGGHDF